MTQGEIIYEGQRPDSSWHPKSGPREGIFLAFQYPVEIPGVNNALLPEGFALNAVRASIAARTSWTLMDFLQPPCARR